MSRSFPLDAWTQKLITAAALIALFFAGSRAAAVVVNLESAEALESVETEETGENDAEGDEFEEPETLPGGIFTEENAYDLPGSPAPGNFRPSMLREFEEMVNEGRLKLANRRKSLEEDRQTRLDTTSWIAEAERLLGRERPDLITALRRIPEGYDVPHSIKNAKGRSQKLRLRGRDSVARDLVRAHQAFRSQENQLSMHSRLTEVLRGVEGVPKVSDVSQLDWSELQHLNRQLFALLEARHGRDHGQAKQPRGYGQCQAEEGAAQSFADEAGDMTGAACSPITHGLLAAADWTLKYANTCVRNQGFRNVGPTFALTAAIESGLAFHENRYVNLSEQHLFSEQRFKWFSAPSEFGDGLDALLTIGAASAIGYRFHHEESWHYNPSESCEQYEGRHCSEASHQARMICATVASYRFCGYEIPMPVATPYRIESMNVILDPLEPSASLENVRSLVRSGIPVVMGFLVSDSFTAAAGANGYVTSSPMTSASGPLDQVALDQVAGGHAALIVGWVPNSRRPAHAPEASGGGYFVVKNSWGRCAGDAGYFYLAYDWVKAFATSLTVVE